jgi:hypothetical protein
MNSRVLDNFSRKAARWSAAAAAVLLISAGVSSYAYFTPVSTISLDVNPSIEYKLNRFDRVVGVEALNEDGQQILEQLKVKNKNIDEALKLTLQQMKAQGFIKHGEANGVMISAAFKNEGQAQAFAAKLKVGVEEDLTELGTAAEVEAVGVGRVRVLAAEAFGITPGKLNLIEKLQASTEDPNDYLDVMEMDKLSVQDIMKLIKANREALKTAANPDAATSDGNGPAKGGKPEVKPGKGNDVSNQNGNNKDKDKDTDKAADENSNPDSNGTGNGNSN